MHKQISLFLAVLFVSSIASAQQIIFRSDDIGCTHAANIGVIKSCTEGISRSAELMVVTPWLPEAVKMLSENPGIDVGIHLALTSEWENMKWRPLTTCNSIVDENGYFYPNTFPTQAYPGQSLIAVKDQIVIDEVEAELRAQIELGLKLVPTITHLSGHMMWGIVSEEISSLIKRLSEEYGLPFVDDRGDTNKRLGIQSLPVKQGASKEEALINALDHVEAGKTYIYIEHPAVGGEEMSAIWHIGYEKVSEDRQSVLNMYTSPRVEEALNNKGIKLISYGDIISEFKK